MEVSDSVGSLAGSGSIALSSHTLTVGGLGVNPFSGPISGSGLTKTGAGTLTLTGVNTYAGGTTINAGTLVVGGSLSDASPLAVGNGAVYQLGADDTVGSIAGSGVIELGGQSLTAGADNSSTEFSGVISGPGNVIKAGAGVLTLSGSNTYTGDTKVDAGTLLVSGSLNDATAMSVTDAATYRAAADQSLASLQGAGEIVLDASELTVGALNSSTTYSGVISGTGGFRKVGEGTLTFGGANTYTGPTRVDAGTLDLAHPSAIGGSSDLRFNGGTVRFSSESSALPPLVVLDAGDGAVDVDAGIAIDMGGVISGSGAFTKTGAGSLTLSGVNTYTGATTVNAGQLAISGGLSDTTPVAVDAGAALELRVDQSFASIAGSGSIVGNALVLGLMTSTVFSG